MRVLTLNFPRDIQQDSSSQPGSLELPVLVFHKLREALSSHFKNRTSSQEILMPEEEAIEGKTSGGLISAWLLSPGVPVLCQAPMSLVPFGCQMRSTSTPQYETHRSRQKGSRKSSRANAGLRGRYGGQRSKRKSGQEGSYST